MKKEIGKCLICNRSIASFYTFCSTCGRDRAKLLKCVENLADALSAQKPHIESLEKTIKALVIQNKHLKRRSELNTQIYIPRHKLMSLIRLCHPDKHMGNKPTELEANEITKWLLEMRRQS